MKKNFNHLGEQDFSTEVKGEWSHYSSLRGEKIPRPKVILANIFISVLIVIAVSLYSIPWQQSSYGYGRLIALDPNYRVQTLHSFVKGRINKWYVQDGMAVKKGDPIVEVLDNDPNYLRRLEKERDAAKAKYEAYVEAAKTGILNYNRQKALYEQGLSSKKKVESANIYYKKLLASEAESAASLAKAEVNFARQQIQTVTAPLDGTIMRVLAGSDSTTVKVGDVLAVFVPDALKVAAEIFVDGNDLPFIYSGRTVRLQFEGWPAIQVPGWPSIAVGTFPGVVYSIDTSAQKNGKFRVIVVPPEDQDWPEIQFLRQETSVQGWVLLNEVRLGYEIWRKFNGFPPTLDDNIQEQTKYRIQRGFGKK